MVINFESVGFAGVDISKQILRFPGLQETRIIDPKFPTIIADTREQDGFYFENYPCNRKRDGLKTGDYSVEGFENWISVERKSKGDLFRSLGCDRTREEKKFKRLALIKYTALVVEADWEDIERPLEYSDMNPSSVRNTIFSWTLKYNFVPLMGNGKFEAERLTYEFLMWALRSCQRKLKKRKRGCKQ